jgi:ribose transport system ATP-binding protein/D-xylose transport system ATP-binding protein
MERFSVEALGIRLNFSGVLALRGCDLRVRQGEIHALLGQNGAGKSTLLKVLNGVHPRVSFDGEIRIDGKSVAFRSPADARTQGVGYVPQEIEVIEHLSVAENIFCGQMSRGGPRTSLLVRWHDLEHETVKLLADLGLSFSPRALVASLTAAQRHLVMIARTLMARPSVLLLDEPTASLSSPEIERLFCVLRKLQERGTTMLYITHRLPEVLELCDRASVLRDGVVAEELERKDFDITRLLTSMSGFKVEMQFPAHRRNVSDHTALKLENFSVIHQGRVRVQDVTFELRRGEILGIAGLLGAGRTELLNAIYGHLPHRGKIYIEGKAQSIRSPRDARALGIGLLTEDRKRDGLLFNLPLRANITIGSLSSLARVGIVQSAKERTSVLRKMKELRIKASSTEATVSHLSGGNQQKLLFARVLLRGPTILLLDDPSKGVDVATRHEIYRLIIELAESGLAVILVSSEVDEVLGLADRTLVMTEGRIVDQFTRGDGDEARVLHSISAALPWNRQVSARTELLS